MKILSKIFKFKRKPSLFKNDPLGIKYKLFNIKLERHIQKGINLRAKELRMCLSVIHTIGIPENEDMRLLLKKTLKLYDDMISDINKEFKMSRMYVEIGEEEKENNNEV